MFEFYGKQIPSTLEELVDPRRSVVLVWDFQYDIAGRAFNREELITRLSSFLDKARENGVPVVYSQHAFLDWRLENPAWIRVRMKVTGAKEPGMLKPFCVEGTEGWKIISEVEPKEGDIVFKKRRPDAFLQSELPLILRGLNRDTILVTGVSTDVGVVGTVRRGSYEGYFMVVVRDCVSSTSKEKHEAALRYLEETYDVYDSAEIIKAWGSSRA